MKFEVVDHRSPRPRIDIGGVPKSEATKTYESMRSYMAFYGATIPEPAPYIEKAEQDRIWKLVEQFAVTTGDSSEVVEGE